jgi:hypothetical protein
MAIRAVYKSPQQTGSTRIRSVPTSACILLQLCLHSIPQVPIDDGHVLTRMRLPLMRNFSEIEPILENLVQCPSRVGLAP